MSCARSADGPYRLSLVHEILRGRAGSKGRSWGLRTDRVGFGRRNGSKDHDCARRVRGMVALGLTRYPRRRSPRTEDCPRLTSRLGKSEGEPVRAELRHQPMRLRFSAGIPLHGNHPGSTAPSSVSISPSPTTASPRSRCQLPPTTHRGLGSKRGFPRKEPTWPRIFEPEHASAHPPGAA